MNKGLKILIGIAAISIIIYLLPTLFYAIAFICIAIGDLIN